MKTAMALGLLAAANLSAADLPQRTHDFRIQPKMEMLRPGEVRPQGWLRDWCESARKGYVSRLDEVHSAFPRAWSADFHPRGKDLNWTDKYRGSWPTEGGAYWFEGLVRLAWALDDAELKAFATKRLTPLLEGMNPNAIGFAYWMDRRDPAQLEEVARASHGYVMGSTGRSTRFMLAYYEATGDARALQALKWCLDDPWPYFYGNPVSIPAGGADTWRYCGDAKIAAALENFRTNYPAMSEKKWPSLMFGKAPVPGDIRLRQRFVLEKNRDWEARLQHGVLTYESLYSFLKLAQWSGDRRLFDDVRAWFDFIDKHAMQVHGVPVADEQWGCPGAERGTETCVVAGYILQAAAMMGATGEGTFGDRAERAFFNAGAGCVARDWMHHVYMQAPNRTTATGNFQRGENWRGGFFRRLHWPLCCTAALTRILPGYIQWMWMKPSAGGLAATLYGPCTLVSGVNGTPVVIETKTAYPFEESVEMSVRPEGEVRFPLFLRMPDWCREPGLTVNGEKPEFAVRDGFAVLDRVWRAGDRVSLRFPMKPAVVRTVDRGQGGKPYGSLTLGPLLFAYALPEKDENTPLPEAKTDWKVDSSKILDGCKVVRGPMPEFWNWQADAPLKLSVTADGGQPLELVPYGCARLRISMFPDVAAAAPAEPVATGLSARLKSAPVWDVMKDAGTVTETLKAKGAYPLDDDHAFAVPQTAVRDSTSFTVYVKVRVNKLEVGQELRLLSQRTADTGWSWSVRYLPQGASPMTFDANGITSRCGWFCRNRKPGVFEYVIAARRGFVTIYSNGRVLKNLVTKIVPNLEPVKVGEKTSRPRLDAELLDLKFYGPGEEFWLPGEKPGFAASTIGGKGWQIDVPAKGQKEGLPKVLLHGDSILGGYGPVVVECLRGVADVYRWGGFDTQPGPVGPNWKEALASADYDIVVFNNGLHSLHWTEARVPDEAVRASYASMVEAIRASAPKARAYCLLTTPYRGEADAVVVRLNDIARSVMSELNVPVIDAYALLKGRDSLRAGDPFHWKGAGYRSLADLVAKTLFPSCGKPE